MPRPRPLEYDSRVDGDRPGSGPTFRRRRQIPRHAHNIAGLACLIVFWGNVGTWALEGNEAGTWRHPWHDELRILWSAVAIIGIVYGALAARAPGHGRFTGRMAIAVNALLLAGMWAWRVGLFSLLSVHT